MTNGARGAGRRARTCLAGAMILLAACATVPAPGGSPTPAAPSASAAPARTGGGTLRQEDVAVSLDVGSVRARVLPLDSSVLATLAPDSRAALLGIVAGRRDAIVRATQMHALRDQDLWYVSFTGLSPDASYTPGDLSITSAGRPFRPLEIIPLTGNFGSGRVGVRQTQAALYLFDDGLDVTQPLSVQVGSARSDDWSQSLRRIERERALMQARR